MGRGVQSAQRSTQVRGGGGSGPPPRQGKSPQPLAQTLPRRNIHPRWDVAGRPRGRRRRLLCGGRARPTGGRLWEGRGRGPRVPETSCVAHTGGLSPAGRACPAGDGCRSSPSVISHPRWALPAVGGHVGASRRSTWRGRVHRVPTVDRAGVHRRPPPWCLHRRAPPPQVPRHPAVPCLDRPPPRRRCAVPSSSPPSPPPPRTWVALVSSRLASPPPVIGGSRGSREQGGTLWDGGICLCRAAGGCSLWSAALSQKGPSCGMIRMPSAVGDRGTRLSEVGRVPVPGSPPDGEPPPRRRPTDEPWRRPRVQSLNTYQISSCW